MEKRGGGKGTAATFGLSTIRSRDPGWDRNSKQTKAERKGNEIIMAARNLVVESRRSNMHRLAMIPIVINNNNIISRHYASLQNPQRIFKFNLSFFSTIHVNDNTRSEANPLNCRMDGR